MRAMFDFFSSPIELNRFIPVVCIENRTAFREVVQFLEGDNFSDEKIVFSKDFEPIDRKHIAYIPNFFELSFSSAFYKKIYADMLRLSNELYLEDSVNINAQIITLLENINKNYDYDFTFNEQLDLIALFKAQQLVVNFESGNKLEELINFILLTQKYAPCQCFVLINMHLYFMDDELSLFYEEMLKRNICVLLIEAMAFPKLNHEKQYILDKDYCEIIESHY